MKHRNRHGAPLRSAAVLPRGPGAAADPVPHAVEPLPVTVALQRLLERVERIGACGRQHAFLGQAYAVLDRDVEITRCAEMSAQPFQLGFQPGPFVVRHHRTVESDRRLQPRQGDAGLVERYGIAGAQRLVIGRDFLEAFGQDQAKSGLTTHGLAEMARPLRADNALPVRTCR